MLSFCHKSFRTFCWMCTFSLLSSNFPRQLILLVIFTNRNDSIFGQNVGSFWCMSKIVCIDKNHDVSTRVANFVWLLHEVCCWRWKRRPNFVLMWIEIRFIVENLRKRAIFEPLIAKQWPTSARCINMKRVFHVKQLYSNVVFIVGNWKAIFTYRSNW